MRFTLEFGIRDDCKVGFRTLSSVFRALGDRSTSD